MNERKKHVNRDELAGIVSDYTGYTKDVVIEIMKAEDLAMSDLIAKGYSIKRHKLFRLDIETRAKKNAYDGINKKRFVSPEKEYVKFVPLKQLKDSLEKLNNTIDK